MSKIHKNSHFFTKSTARKTSPFILPLNNIKETEAYCPTYENGTHLALIRYPHAGTFEIPMVTVNNKNLSGKRNLGAIQDAIGINAKVAERLSGADFDGDTVMAIPVSDKVNIKSTHALKALEGFDPKTAYAVPEGNPNNVRLMKKEEKQREMGVISNLITDMTLRGADEDELARAVKHSMVVIDAEKHKLDYKRSERENGIPELKQKWQIRVDEEGGTHYGGASTLLSRRKQTVRVPERRGSVRVDKDTGELIYKESGRTFTDPKTGKERLAEDTVSLISETKDARALSSGTVQENLYADFSNKLKAMANQARKEAANRGVLLHEGNHHRLCYKRAGEAESRAGREDLHSAHRGGRRRPLPESAESRKPCPAHQNGDKADRKVGAVRYGVHLHELRRHRPCNARADRL